MSQKLSFSVKATGDSTKRHLHVLQDQGENTVQEGIQQTFVERTADYVACHLNKFHSDKTRR